MKTIGIFYGSSTGNTAVVAKQIASKLGVGKEHVFDVSNVAVEQLANYDVLIFGSSTWGLGDLQDDWDGFVGKLSKQNLSGKKVAVFGLGDSSSYSDTFCDAMDALVKGAEKAGATIVGQGVDPSGYTFDDSQSLHDGKFCGLPLDADNEPEETEERINQWIIQVKNECSC